MFHNLTLLSHQGLGHFNIFKVLSKNKIIMELQVPKERIPQIVNDTIRTDLNHHQFTREHFFFLFFFQNF